MDEKLDNYREIVGDKAIDSIEEDASKLAGKRIVHVNSEPMRGGVAILLNSLLPLFNDLGIRASWRVLKGTKDFFDVTKAIHNSLQGGEMNLTNIKKQIYTGWNKKNAMMDCFEGQECVIIHDPQPLPRINFHRKEQPWIWRCHIDVSHPNPVILDYIKDFVSKYDLGIYTRKSYGKNFPIPSAEIRPSVDPLVAKNKELSEKVISKYLHRRGIGREKPTIAQISRFDKWKDPLGVIEVYERVKEKVDCQLVLVGSIALDDPEGREVYNEVREEAEKHRDIYIMANATDIEINIIQSVADVVIQKSLREGFGLTVSEALWKGKPVVGMRVGGIPLQIEDGKSGYLVDNWIECVDRVIKLLKDEKLRKRMGKRGKQFVKENYLLPRHLHEWVQILAKILK